MPDAKLASCIFTIFLSQLHLESGQYHPCHITGETKAERFGHQSKVTQLERESSPSFPESRTHVVILPLSTMWLHSATSQTSPILLSRFWDMWFLSWSSLQLGGKDRCWELPFFPKLYSFVPHTNLAKQLEVGKGIMIVPIYRHREWYPEAMNGQQKATWDLDPRVSDSESHILSSIPHHCDVHKSFWERWRVLSKVKSTLFINLL